MTLLGTLQAVHDFLGLGLAITRSRMGSRSVCPASSSEGDGLAGKPTRPETLSGNDPERGGLWPRPTDLGAASRTRRPTSGAHSPEYRAVQPEDPSRTTQGSAGAFVT